MAKPESTTIPPRLIPALRWERFDVYANHDGTFHINVANDSGGYMFATGFESRGEAGWACALFNAAIGAIPKHSA